MKYNYSHIQKCSLTNSSILSAPPNKGILYDDSRQKIITPRQAEGILDVFDKFADYVKYIAYKLRSRAYEAREIARTISERYDDTVDCITDVCITTLKSISAEWLEIMVEII